MVKRNFKLFFPVVGLLLLQYVVYSYLKEKNFFVNSWYPEFYKNFQTYYSWVFNKLPFSFGDLIYVFLIAGLILTLFYLIYYVLIKKETYYIKKIIYTWLITLNVLYFAFHWFWGFNYYKTNIYDNTIQDEVQLYELKEIAEIELQKAKDLRQGLKEDKNGYLVYNSNEFILTNESISFSIQTEGIISNFQPKKSLFSPLMKYFGVSGYYNPFTAEAQVTEGIPRVSMPFTQCHETAHFLGYAPEFEANFIGYILAVHSKQDIQKYSAHYKALQYVLREIYHYDQVYVKEIIDDYSDGMKRDRKEQIEFYNKYSGKTSEAFSAMNNHYLKANQQTEGIESYNEFVDYLVYYYRSSSTSKVFFNFTN